MSVAVISPTTLILNNDWPFTPNTMFSALLPSGSCNLTVKTTKSLISRSREGSPCAEKLSSCRGCGRGLPNGSSTGLNSPRGSPMMTRQRVNISHCVNSAMITPIVTPIATTIVNSVSPASVCEKIKDLNVTPSPQPICPETLSEWLKEGSDRDPLLLDCRPFIAYNMVHVKGALSLNCCDRLTRKRMHCGKIQLVDIISGTAGKDEFNRKKEKSDIVVYDERTCDMDSEGPCSPIKLVTTNLQREGHQVYYLKGGLRELQNDHADILRKPEYKPPPKLLYSPTTPTCIDNDIDTAVVSQILPFLYLGNARDAANMDCLKEHGITHVLNVTSHIPLHFEGQGIVYKRLPASDSGCQNLKQYFNDAYTFIEESIKAGGKVLVHCQAGVSRSVTITVSYIMKRSKMAMLDAFKCVKAQRSIVAPNFNFMGQLFELEQQLNEGVVERVLEPKLPLENTSLF